MSDNCLPEKQEIKEQLADFLREHYSLQMDELEGLTAIIRQWLIKKKKLNNDNKGKTKTSFNRLLNKTLDIANSQIDELIKELDKEIKP